MNFEFLINLTKINPLRLRRHVERGGLKFQPPKSHFFFIVSAFLHKPKVGNLEPIIVWCGGAGAVSL
jgi:hypothetical protein